MGKDAIRKGDKFSSNTVKPLIVATSIKYCTACITQACIQIPKEANTPKCTCMKQAPFLNKKILIIPYVFAYDICWTKESFRMALLSIYSFI